MAAAPYLLKPAAAATLAFCALHIGRPELMLESLVMTQQFGIAAAVLAHLPALHDNAMLLCYARRARTANFVHAFHLPCMALLSLCTYPHAGNCKPIPGSLPYAFLWAPGFCIRLGSMTARGLLLTSRQAVTFDNWYVIPARESRDSTPVSTPLGQRASGIGAFGALSIHIALLRSSLLTCRAAVQHCQRAHDCCLATCAGQQDSACVRLQGGW